MDTNITGAQLELPFGDVVTKPSKPINDPLAPEVAQAAESPIVTGEPVSNKPAALAPETIIRTDIDSDASLSAPRRIALIPQVRPRNLISSLEEIPREDPRSTRYFGGRFEDGAPPPVAAGAWVSSAMGDQSSFQNRPFPSTEASSATGQLDPVTDCVVEPTGVSSDDSVSESAQAIATEEVRLAAELCPTNPRLSAPRSAGIDSEPGSIESILTGTINLPPRRAVEVRWGDEDLNPQGNIRPFNGIHVRGTRRPKPLRAEETQSPFRPRVRRVPSESAHATPTDKLLSRHPKSYVSIQKGAAGRGIRDLLRIRKFAFESVVFFALCSFRNLEFYPVRLTFKNPLHPDVAQPTERFRTIYREGVVWIRENVSLHGSNDKDRNQGGKVRDRRIIGALDKTEHGGVK